MSRPEFPANVQCPCCNSPIAAPSVEIVADAYGIQPQGAKILKAIWAGRGMPVSTQRIFDAMYKDDPDGGPSENQMRAALKWSLHHMRAKLKGSGWTIITAGYNAGYRLALEQAGDE